MAKPTSTENRRRRLRLAGVFVAVAVGVMAALAGAAFAQVSTDQQDYAPGSLVTVSGGNDSNGNPGYVQGNTVTVDATNIDTGWTGSCSTTITASDGSWSCAFNLSTDSSQAVGSYTYTAYSTDANGNPIQENGTFTDAVGFNIAGTDGGQHQPAGGPTPRSNEQDLGSVTLGTTLALGAHTNCTTTPYNGLKVTAPGIGTGTQTFTLGYGSFTGDTNDNSTLSAKTTLSETSGSLTGSSDYDCVGMSINTTGLTAGTTYHGTLQASGSINAGYYLFKFSVTAASNVAPSIAWATDGNPSTANEGDTKTYTFNITDSDSSSWSFVSGYPDCGTGGSLVANSASIDNTAKTGTFQCSFPDGPASPTVKAKVTDGTDASNELTQAVTVANVKPTPTIDSLTGNSGTACINGNTVTLGFSWTDPAGSYDTYSYDVNWGDGSTHATGSNATSPVSNLQHTYSAGGPYTITVTVNDEDPGSGNSVSSDPFSFLYNVTGVLQPVNDTQAHQDPSIFKYGSTIPVKIEVTDCNATPVSGLSPQITIKKISGSTPPTGTDEPISSTSGADTGTTMRWSDPIYIYNLATKSLSDSSATYQITVTGPFATVTSLFGTKPK